MASTLTTGAAPGGASDALASGGAGAPETMDDVLGLGDPGADTATAEIPEIEIPEDVAEGTEQVEQPETVADEDVDLRTFPQWAKDAMKANADPKVQAAIKQYINRAQGFSQTFKTPAEARQLAEKIQQVGGLKRVEELATSERDAMAQDQAFFSGDPEQQTPIISQWLAKDPNSVYVAFQTTGDLLKRNYPDEYRSYAQGIVKSAFDELTRGKFDGFFNGMRQAYQSGNQEVINGYREKLSDFIMEEAESLGLVPKAAATAAGDPASKAFEKQRADFQKQQQDFHTTRFNDFKTSFKASMDNETAKMAKAMTERAWAKAKLTPEAVERISSDLSSEVAKAVTGNQDVQRQILALIDPSGKRNPANYQMSGQAMNQVVQLLAGKAKAAMPGIARQVFDRWTKIIVGQRKAEITNRQSNAKRADISSGAPRGAGTNQVLTDKEIKEKGMSMEDILADPRPVQKRR